MELLRCRESHLFRTRRGNVISRSIEIYTRDTVACGSSLCNDCVYLPPMEATLSKKIYLIPNLMTIKQQIDVITSPSFLSKVNVILLQTIIDALRESNFSLYKRIESELVECRTHKASIFVLMDRFHKHTKIKRGKDESLNDFRFRQMVRVYKWYQSHLALAGIDDSHLFVITESAKKVKLLSLLNVAAVELSFFVKELFPAHLSNLQDSLSIVVDDEGDKKKDALLYKPHWTRSRVEMELKKTGSNVYRGTFNSVRGGGNSPFGKVRIGGGEEVRIYGMSNINRAVHEDVVAIRLLSNKEGEAEVVSVIEKKWRAYCGSLQELAPGQQQKQSGFVLFVPIDGRIPKIGIKTSQIANLMDKRIIVNIDNWSINSKYPSGHYTETIGVIGDLETETQVLLLEHDIPFSPWSDAVLSCLPPSEPDNEVKLEKVQDLSLRRNLIKEGYSILSVDPPGCVDIDDALHCKELPNGNLEIGVHIADVSYYVQSNSALDIEAAKRGTSVYLVDRRIDMLPSLLSTDLCSLKPRKTRLAFSVFWEIRVDSHSGTLEIVNTSFHRCVIRSVAALAYEEAQNMIDDESDHSENATALRNLLMVSKILKRQRMDEGALSLSSLQPKFKFDKKNPKSKNPKSLTSYPMFPTNSMIEEFMLLANISVAKKILNAFPSFAMLRRHPKPTMAMLAPLVKYAGIRGFKINTENSKKLAESLDRCVDAKDSSFNQLMRIITTRCMTQAIYFISGSVSGANEFRHYGLASSIYTHFTSPIRRYADIIVHRQLAYCCGFKSPNNDNDIVYIKNTELMHDIVTSINRRHRLAQYINRASCNLYTLMFFDNKCSVEKPIICSGIVSGIDANCLNVFVPDYCMERRIYLENKQEWHFDPDELCLTKQTPPSIKYRIFDKVRVKIFVFTSRYHRKKLIIEIIDKNSAMKTNVSDNIEIPTSNDVM